MAYTRGMKRRSSYIPKWGAKRRRSYRRPVARRRSSRSSAFSSQTGKTAMFGYRNRRTNYRRYKRILWDTSTVREHHRSLLTTNTFITSALPQTQASLTLLPGISDNFWNLLGGGLEPAVVDSKVYIRGGLSTLRFKNSFTESQNYVVYWVRTTKYGSGLSLPAIVDISWDPTILLDDQRTIRVLKSFRFSLEPGDTNTLVQRISTRRIDTVDFNNGVDREYWLILANDFSALTGNTDCFRSHNLSFTYDRF